MLCRASVGLIQNVGIRGYRRHLLPMLTEMNKRQQMAGERILPKRSSLLEWDFSRELNALCRRLAIEPTENLRQSFVSPQFAEAENARIEQLGIETEPAQSHTGLAQQGLKKLREVLKAQLRECYPYLPGQAVDRIMEYLVSPDTLVNVAYQMGLQPLVFRAGTSQDVAPELLYDTILAMIAAVRQPEDFCRRFILIQLCGKDVFDLWNPKDVSFMLNDLLSQQKLPPFVPRVIGEAGRNTLESLFYVGVYSDGKMLGKGAGSSQAQAVDVAVRDALKRAFRVDRATRSPFEKFAMETLTYKMNPVEKTA